MKLLCRITDNDSKNSSLQKSGRKIGRLVRLSSATLVRKSKVRFCQRVGRSIAIIKNNPESFPESQKKKGLRKCVVTKHNTLYYSFDAEKIYILTVFDTRQHPNKLNEDL